MMYIEGGSVVYFFAYVFELLFTRHTKACELHNYEIKL